MLPVSFLPRTVPGPLWMLSKYYSIKASLTRVVFLRASWNISCNFPFRVSGKICFYILWMFYNLSSLMSHIPSYCNKTSQLLSGLPILQFNQLISSCGHIHIQNISFPVWEMEGLAKHLSDALSFSCGRILADIPKVPFISVSASVSRIFQINNFLCPTFPPLLCSSSESYPIKSQ